MEEIVLGKIVNTIGLKGELKIFSNFVVEKDLLKDIKKVKINNKEYEVEKLNYRSNFLVLKLIGLDDINLVENFKNTDVVLTQDNNFNLKNGEYFSADLIGCKITDKNGEFLGEITTVENYGATDVIFIKNGKTEYSVPFLTNIFEVVDTEKKQIIASEEFFKVRVLWK